MKTIQIKVSIDGVNYLSKPFEAELEDVFKHTDEVLLGQFPYGFKLTNGNQIYFGSELIKKSIITIIEL